MDVVLTHFFPQDVVSHILLDFLSPEYYYDKQERNIKRVHRLSPKRMRRSHEILKRHLHLRRRHSTRMWEFNWIATNVPPHINMPVHAFFALPPSSTTAREMHEMIRQRAAMFPQEMHARIIGYYRIVHTSSSKRMPQFMMKMGYAIVDQGIRRFQMEWVIMVDSKLFDHTPCAYMPMRRSRPRPPIN